MCDLKPHRMRFMAFQCAIHGISACDSWPIDVRFTAYRCATHALSVYNSYSFSARFTATRKRSVASRHSAEKRNPGLTARPANHLDAFWIPPFSGMTA